MEITSRVKNLSNLGNYYKDEKRGSGKYHFYEGRILCSEFNPLPSQISKI
jgi:hypothetical protein